MTSMAPSSMAAPASSPATAALEAHIPEEDLQTLQLFIENALDLMLKGNSTSYQFLIQQLNPLSGKSDIATRRKIFLALPRCISTMAKEPKAYHQLLDVLFKFDFLGAREEIDAYTRFVVHLVSSNTVYVLPLLQMLVRNMCRPQQLPPALAAAMAPAPVAAAPVRAGRISIGGSFGVAAAPPPPAPVAPAIDIETRFQERYDDVHATLQRVLKLAPTATNALFPVVVEHFPHKRLDAPFQVAYLRNVLKLCTYVPGLQERIFALIIDRLVAVDVEIKLDEKEEDVFTMDDFLDDDLLPGDGASHLDEMAEKLDHMMVIMFEHIERQVYATTANGETAADGAKPLKGDQASLLFKFLLKVFEHSILNTHRSKYPQFLLFYVCQLDPQFQDVFISQLLSASLDPQTPPVTRHSCGAYLASFLARAKYISVAYIQKALYHLLKWMHDQMDIYDNTFLQQQAPTSDDDNDGASGKGRDHDGESTSHKARRGMEAEAEDLEKNKRGYFHESIYISTLQTVCYLVCFRGLELTQSDNGYEFLRSLGWERLLITQTSYCPLAFCQPTVAIEFLNFAETFDLVSEECIDKVDQAINSIGKMQKRTKGSKSMERTAPPPTAVVMASSNMPASLSGSSVLGLRQPLETFFPFDPYLLRRSFRFIGPLYLYWKHADPTSSENAEALNTVKEIIRAYHENEEDEDGSDDDQDQDDDDDDDDDDDGDDDDSESMALSTSITMASFREESYLSTSQNYSMSIDSTLDDDDRAMAAAYGMGMGMGVSTHSLGSSSDMPRRIKRSRRALTPRSTFAPSPALSASSPPSQLPPLESSGGGMRNGFALSGYGDDDDDEGF